MMGFANMRSGVFASVSAHLLLVLVAQFGLPHFFTPPPVSVTIIPVELVTIDDINAPPPPATPEPEPEPEAATPPPPPPPPKAAPEPEPEPEVVEAPPPPVEKPKPPKKEPPKEPEKVKPKPSQLAKAAPLSKPKPPKPPKPLRDFADILKDLPLEKTQVAQKPAAPKDEGKPAPTPPQISDQVSITEIERLKQMMREQIKPCWSPPVGAAGAEELAVTIFIRIDQHGNVSEARVLNAEAMSRNTFAQAAADAARRAVLNPRCQPFQLPQKRYDLWKEIKFSFDPREMLG